jgi:hypothetical protein
MNFNLSEWALKNKGLILYFMILLGIVGMLSYAKLSQSEDPPFTFKVMVVQTYWPKTRCAPKTSRMSGTACARRSMTSAMSCLAACRGHFSTMNSAILSATSMC